MGLSIWRRALVLGGIRSGKSEYAEELAARVGGSVRYVATARARPDDPAWTARIQAHQARRAPAWSTTELGEDPTALPGLLGAAAPDEVVLVDDLGIWAAAVMEVTPAPYERLIGELTDAVAACLSPLVLVSPEVGLSLVPLTEAGRIFADLVGGMNRAVATACDAVVLVVAGNAVPVKGGL